jgi:hypothetical protein
MFVKSAMRPIGGSCFVVREKDGELCAETAGGRKRVLRSDQTTKPAAPQAA